ncbi:hypothetical protein GYH30_044521 [Glycine max]|nr:hypothetical protein GYH30_044521 [Glycine max]
MDSTTFLFKHRCNLVPFDVVAFGSNDVVGQPFNGGGCRCNDVVALTHNVGAAIPDLKSLPFNVVRHAGNVFEGEPATTGLQSSPLQESCASKIVDGDRRRLAEGLRRRLIQSRPCTVVELQ